MDGLRMRSIGVERAGRERTADVKPGTRESDADSGVDHERERVMTSAAFPHILSASLLHLHFALARSTLSTFNTGRYLNWHIQTTVMYASA